MRNLYRLVILLALSTVASATQAEKLNSVSYGTLSSLPQRDADLSLRYGDDPLQRIYHWQTDSKAKGTIIFIHGGCWLNTYDIAHSKGFMTDLADRGYQVYGIEYRRAGDSGGGWPGSFNDIEQALALLSDKLVEAPPVILAGHSAGGHLALLAASSIDVDQVIGLSAITDIEQYAQGDNSCQSATQTFMQQSPKAAPDIWQAANPRHHTMPSSVILLHGGNDKIVPVEQSAWQGVDRELVSGAGHFDWLHPDTQAYASFLTILRERNAISDSP